MSLHTLGWLIVLFGAAFTVTGQVRPGGIHVPGTTVAHEAPLLNWEEVKQSEFSLGDPNPVSYVPFRTYSLESVLGQQRWVERSYHWDSSYTPIVDKITVYPEGTRIVEAVTGWSPSSRSSWYGYPDLKIALLVPIASPPPSTPSSLINNHLNAANLRRIPVAQALGYKRGVSVKPAQSKRPGACDLSSTYPSDAPLQASCVFLDPGQSVDLPNKVRILRVGDSYRIMSGGSLLEDLPVGFTIIHADARYYTLRDLGTF